MKKKTIIAIVAVLLVLALIIGGIFAYFTSTDSATNVFTIGNVSIDLTEPAWDNAIVSPATMPAAAQNMVPGGSVAKDPKITNNGTNDANVFMKVVIPCYEVSGTPVDVFTTQYISTAAVAEPATPAVYSEGVNPAWKLVGTAEYDSTNHTRTYVYAYAGGTTAADLTDISNGVSTVPLFDQVTLTTNTAAAQAAADAASAQGGSNPEINVYAYGIQTEEVTQNTQLAIFHLFDATYNAEP